MPQNYLFCQFLMIHIKSERLRQGEFWDEAILILKNIGSKN